MKPRLPNVYKTSNVIAKALKGAWRCSFQGAADGNAIAKLLLELYDSSA